MKRFVLPLALALAACSNATPTVETAEPSPTDSFLEQLQKDYPVTLSELAPGVWVHTTVYRLPGQAPVPINGLFIDDGDAITLVDGAWGELATVALIEKVRAETGKPVTRLIVTQHDAARTLGVDAAEREGLEVFTHPATPGLAARAGYPVPNTSVAALNTPQSRTKVGRVEVAFPGPGASPDNLVVYLPEEKILYAGFFVRGAGAETLSASDDVDLQAWRDALVWTKTTYRETETVVPGRGKGADILLIDATARLIDQALAETTSD